MNSNASGRGKELATMTIVSVIVPSWVFRVRKQCTSWQLGNSVRINDFDRDISEQDVIVMGGERSQEVKVWYSPMATLGSWRVSSSRLPDVGRQCPGLF